MIISKKNSKTFSKFSTTLSDNFQKKINFFFWIIKCRTSYEPTVFSIRIWRYLPNCSRKNQQRVIVQICEINPSSPKTSNWGWIVISMRLESFRLSCKYQVLVFPGHWLPTWFTFTQSSLAKDLAARSGSNFFPKVALAMSYILWPLGFAYFLLHKFSRIYARNVFMLASSDNPMYTTSSTTKFRSFFYNILKWEEELVRGAQIS